MTAPASSDAAQLEQDPTLPGIPPADTAPPAEPKDTKPRRPRRPRVTKPKDPAAPAAKAPAAKGPGRPSKSAQLTKQLEELIGASFGIGAVAFAGAAGPGAPGSISADMMIVAGQASQLAAALVKVSETNPQVRTLLERTVSTGAYGELLTVVIGGIAIPILANHGALPGMFGALAGGAPAPAPEDPSGPPSP